MLIYVFSLWQIYVLNMDRRFDNDAQEIFIILTSEIWTSHRIDIPTSGLWDKDEG